MLNCPLVRSAGLFFFVFAAVGDGIVAQQISVQSGGGTDNNKIQKVDDDHPYPSIRYGNSRQSRRWVETATGRVAVDEGIAYDGIEVYMALTWHLVAVDAATEETRWSNNVSAFWNQMSIEPMTVDGQERLVVALSTGRDDETRDLRERYDLRTGKKIESPADSPDGRKRDVERQFFGANCGCQEPIAELVTDVERWNELYDQFFVGTAETLPREDLFDDSSQVLLVMSSGNSVNCRGISIQSLYENEERFLIRLHRHTYQSAGETPRVQPYGVMVLPKNKSKKYIVQSNRQRFIGGPPLWRKVHEFEIDEPLP